MVTVRNLAGNCGAQGAARVLAREVARRPTAVHVRVRTT